MKIFLLEKIPCECKEELLKRERYYLENFDCVNVQIPGRTIKEWCEENKERLKEKSKKYYYEENEKCKKTRKDYALKNPEKMKEIKRNYYEKNIELYKKINSIKTTCECGCIIIKNNIKAHKKTKKHHQRMNQA